MVSIQMQVFCQRESYTCPILVPIDLAGNVLGKYKVLPFFIEDVIRVDCMRLDECTLAAPKILSRGTPLLR